jgi:hypothetical protein
LDEFLPGFSLVLGVEFSLPPINDLFSLRIDLLKKGVIGLSGHLLYPSDLLGARWKFLPMGAPLTLGIIHSYHLYLNAVASVLTSSSASICLFLLSTITAHWSIAIHDASYFKGFPQM